MPIGKADGGRDALHGTSVFQVKFTIAPDKVRDPVTWLLAAIDAESEKILELVARGARSYFLVTNVEGTGNLDSGTIDRLKIELGSRSSRWSISIEPWWRETVDAQLSAAPNDLVRPFIRVLPPDQILALTKLDNSGERRRDRVLLAYLRDRYDVDDQIRFGEVDLLGPTVHKLFVDVPVASREVHSAPYEMMAELGDGEVHHVRQNANIAKGGQWQAGGAQMLLHPTWRGNALIVGGPGQGKTTLLQYVCQVYRSLHLDRTEYLTANRGHRPDVARVPLRIELREYAVWMSNLAERRKRNHDTSEAIEEYLSVEISQHSGNLKFNTDDLAEIFAQRPAILALDGLDEVADIDLRARVAEQISKTATRLQSPEFDVVIVVTTRPGATAAPQQLGGRFPQLLMQRLTKRLQLSYLRRWAEQTSLDTATVNEVRTQFIANQNLPHVAELASSPMQMAILLHLLQRQKILPEQRTELYADYVRVFFDRESPKEPIVALHRKLILALHRFLAWHLQAAAEKGNSSGGLSLEALKTLLSQFLQEYDDSVPDLVALFNSVTSRVVCLVQRTSGVFEFEVQPLREYFAASYLAERAQPRGAGTKDARLSEMIKRPYWSNVLRFFVGMWSEAELKGVPTICREIRAQAPYDVLPLTRTVLVQLLRDQVYQDMTTVAVRGAVDAALEGAGCLLAVDGLLDNSGEALQLASGTAARQVAEYARERLKNESNGHYRAALASLLRQHGDPRSIRAWCWSDEVRQETVAWLSMAATAGALAQLSAAEEKHVIKCAETSNERQNRVPVLPFVIAAGGEIEASPLGRACMADLADGHGSQDITLNVPEGSVLEKLLRATDPSQIYMHRRAALHSGATVGASITKRGSKPRTETDPELLVQDLLVAHGVEDWQQPSSWVHLFSLLVSGFGDSWLLRQSILIMPPTIVLPNAERPRLASGAQPEAVASWLRQAQHHKDDAQWWGAQCPSADDSVAARTWLAALILMAKANVVGACLGQVGELLSAFPAHVSASILEFIRRFYSESAPRRLDLYAPLHGRTLKPSPLTAILLYDAAFDTTRAELFPVIFEHITEIVAIRSDVTAMVLSIVAEHQTKPLRLNAFAGTRAQVFPGQLTTSPKFALLTESQAARVLSNPEQWPVDFVITAIRVITAGLGHQRPLADVAQASQWFAPT
jgi:hypothetical protein